jgi:hypothetical protein
MLSVSPRMFGITATYENAIAGKQYRRYSRSPRYHKWMNKGSPTNDVWPPICDGCSILPSQPWGLRGRSDRASDGVQPCQLSRLAKFSKMSIGNEEPSLKGTILPDQFERAE